MDGRDVRTVERGEQLCLAGESGHAVEILREGFRENSGRDFAIQLGAGRAIDFGHPALTELRCDGIVRDGSGRSHIAALVAWYHHRTAQMQEQEQERMTSKRHSRQGRFGLSATR